MKHFSLNENEKFIKIHSQDQDALDAALKHAETKFKLFALRGSPEQKQALAARAVRLGVDGKVANPELNDFLSKERLTYQKEELERGHLQTPQDDIGREVKVNEKAQLNATHDERIIAENIEPRVFKRDAEDRLVSNFRIPYDAMGRTHINRIAAVEKHIEKLDAFSKAALVAGAKHVSERAALQSQIERLDHLEIKELDREAYLDRYNELQSRLAEQDLEYQSLYTTTANDRLHKVSQRQLGKEQTAETKGIQSIEKKEIQSADPFLFRGTLNPDERRRYEEFEASVKSQMRLRHGGRDVLMFREQQLLNEEFKKREVQLKTQVNIIKPETKDTKLEVKAPAHEAITVNPKLELGESEIFKGLKIGTKDIKVVDKEKLEEDLQQQL